MDRLVQENLPALCKAVGGFAAAYVKQTLQSLFTFGKGVGEVVNPDSVHEQAVPRITPGEVVSDAALALQGLFHIPRAVFHSFRMRVPEAVAGAAEQTLEEIREIADGQNVPNGEE